MNRLLDVIRQDDLDLNGEIWECIERGQFKPIIRDDNLIGYLTWHKIYKNGKLYHFINNLFILPEYRKRDNILFLRSFFRGLHRRGIEYWYWKNTKHNHWFRITRRI